MRKLLRLFLLTAACLIFSVSFSVTTGASSETSASRPKIISLKLKPDTSVQIKWSMANKAEKYELYVSVNSRKYKKLKVLKRHYFTHRKLKAGYTYSYKVRAINGKKKGKFSKTKKIKIPVKTSAASENASTADQKESANSLVNPQKQENDGNSADANQADSTNTKQNGQSNQDSGQGSGDNTDSGDDESSIFTSWNAVGDSITAGNYYYEAVQNSLKFSTARKCGVSGSCLAKNTLSEADIHRTMPGMYTEPFSICERIQNIPDADLWTIFGGTNDYYYDSKLGHLDRDKSRNYDISTVYGALQSICENILNRPNHPLLMLITPLRSNRHKFQGMTGETEFRDIAVAFHEISSLYGVPLIDLWDECEINNENVDQYTLDGVHPNQKGKELISQIISGRIRQYVTESKQTEANQNPSSP